MFLQFLQNRWGRAIMWLGIALAVLVALTIVAIDVFKVGSVALPPAVTVDVTPLEQGWKPGWQIGQSQWFHHADQGTKILNYEWFLALQQRSEERRVGKESVTRREPCRRTEK